jgi:uncharacterized membrane protein (UPF0127 family)
LFSGKLGFEEVKVFANPYIGLMDEQAEETWSVFDHPVIRIYRRKGAKPRFDSAGYDETVFELEGTKYRLFIADTPEKQRMGLMYVRSKKDLGGADGMVFVFKDKSIRTFWNMNTVADLDLYWLSDGRNSRQNRTPLDRKIGNRDHRHLASRRQPGGRTAQIRLLLECLDAGKRPYSRSAQAWRLRPLRYG